MSDKTLKRDEAKRFDEKQIAAEENLIIDAQFLIQEALYERGMTRSDLAQRTGISKARLSQLMRAEANPTLRTLAKLFYALDDQLCLSRKRGLAHACESNESWAVGTKNVKPMAFLELKYDFDFGDQFLSEVRWASNDNRTRAQDSCPSAA